MHKVKIGKSDLVFKPIDHLDHLIQHAYQLRYQVFCNEKGIIPYEFFPQKYETDAYDPFSIHLVVEDQVGIVGTARIILDNPYRFPFEIYCKDSLYIDMSKFQRDHIAEISRLAISKKVRQERKNHWLHDNSVSDKAVGADKKNGEAAEKSGKISRKIEEVTKGIYREIYQECKRRGVTHLFAIMERSLQLLLRKQHIVFSPIGDSINYYGEVKPYMCDIAVSEKYLYEHSQDFLYNILDGLEPAYHPEFLNNIP